MGDFSHLDENGKAAMVDTTGKAVSYREAEAIGKVVIPASCREKFKTEIVDEIARTARIAAIQAAKQTAHLIPMCHPIPLTGIEAIVTFHPERSEFQCGVIAKTQSQTGVEMEALTALSVAALTVYDMVKAIAPESILGPFQLARKEGGKTGKWLNPNSLH